MPTIDLPAALHQHFGYPAFRPGQAEALEHVLAGRNLLVVMPTGSGKSLIYQLAALCLPGTALVVSPLVALMKDQVDSLARRQLPATYINATLSLEEQNRRLRALQAGEYKIVFVAPERFRSVGFRSVISRIPLSLLAVDEAHCLSQWGHDFRPDYLYLAEARRQLTPPVTLALTATATPRVQEDILHLLNLEQAARVITGFNRPNLAFHVVRAQRTVDKLARLTESLAGLSGAGLIYTGTRREAEEVAAYIRTQLRRPAEHYHAGLPDETRARVQDAFMAGDLPLVVATNAFGLGIDRPDVRFVLHYTMPGTLEAYYQEAGRAGRDGLPAEALLLHAPKDVALHRFFIDNASPTGAELRQVHEHLRRLSEATDLAALAQALNLEGTKVRVVLEQLETAKAVRRVDEAYGRMRLEAAPLTEAALRGLEQTAAERRRYKYDLLGRMVDYTQTHACRRRVMLKHFGDNDPSEVPPKDCCDNCARGTAQPAATTRRPAAGRAPVPAAETLPTADDAPAAPNALASLSQAERGALIVLDALTKLDHPLGKTRLAQFLQGSESEAMAKYKGRAYFGRLGELRLNAIEALIDQLLDSQHLEQGGGLYPTLQLTPLGEHALRHRSAIAVSLNRAPRVGPALNADGSSGSSATLTITAALLARGSTPEQIAAERGLTESTIYSHLATLIAEGQVDVAAVVPAEAQAKITAAIEAVGSAAYLAPIKARLNDFTTYGEIRCVAEAWKRQHPTPGNAT